MFAANSLTAAAAAAAAAAIANSTSIFTRPNHYGYIDRKTDVTPAILSRDFVARLHRAIKSQHATVQLHAATLSRKQPKSTTDHDILLSSLVLVGCLAKRKRTIQSKRPEKIGYGTISSFWNCEGGS